MFQNLWRRDRSSKVESWHSLNPDFPVSLQVCWWLLAAKFLGTRNKRIAIAVDSVLAKPWKLAIKQGLDRNSREGFFPSNTQELGIALGVSSGQGWRKSQGNGNSVRDSYKIAAAVGIPISSLLPFDWKEWLMKVIEFLCGKGISGQQIEIYVAYWEARPRNPRKGLDASIIGRLADLTGRGTGEVETDLREAGRRIDAVLQLSESEKSRLDYFLHHGDVP